LAYLAVAVLFLGAVAATTALRGDDGAATGTGNGREVAARGPARPSDAGATTVQIYSALIYEGPGVVGTLTAGTGDREPVLRGR